MIIFYYHICYCYYQIQEPPPPPPPPPAVLQIPFPSTSHQIWKKTHVSFLEAQQHRKVAPSRVGWFHDCPTPAGYCCNVGDKDGLPPVGRWVKIFHPPLDPSGNNLAPKNSFDPKTIYILPGSLTAKALENLPGLQGKKGLPKRKLVFQSSFFRGDFVKTSGAMLVSFWNLQWSESGSQHSQLSQPSSPFSHFFRPQNKFVNKKQTALGCPWKLVIT